MKRYLLLAGAALCLTGLIAWFFVAGQEALWLRRIRQLRHGLAESRDSQDIMLTRAELTYLRDRLTRKGYLEKRSFPVELAMHRNIYQDHFYPFLLQYERRRLAECVAVCFVPEISGEEEGNLHIESVTVWDRHSAIPGWTKIIEEAREVARTSSDRRPSQLEPEPL